MMLARVCRGTLAPQTQKFFSAPVVSKPQLSQIQITRLFASDGRSTFTRSARRRTLAEGALAPAGETGKQRHYF